MYKAVLSAQVQPNAAKLIRQHFTVQKDKDLKHCAKATQEFPKAQKRNLFQWPIQSTDLTGTEHAFTEVTEDNSDGRKTHSQAASEGNCSLEEHLKGGNSI